MTKTSEWHDMTDESLMACVQNGEHGAFAVLVRRHTKLFFTAAYRMCGKPDESEDIVQEAFLKLWHQPQSWDKDRGAKFTTWFYRVVTNQAIDYLRRKKPTKSGEGVLERVEDTRSGQLEQMEENEEQAFLEKAIQALPERQRTALNLCFYEGLSNKEAADIMGIGVKALESLLMRAKAAIRDELTNNGFLGAQEDKKQGEGKEKKYG